MLKSVFLSAYVGGRCGNVILKFALQLEGGQFYSSTARDIMQRYHGVKIGAYSYGECFRPGAFPSGVTIGRYVSVAADVRIFLRDHPIARLPMHPFFYNSALGYVSADNIPESNLMIDHEAWIGARTIITSGCKRIGIGAVVGAGAVVTKDVPDFAVVVGNPGRIVKFRFPDHFRSEIIKSHWWEKSIDQLKEFIPKMTTPVGTEGFQHPLLKIDQNAQTSNAPSS